MSKETIEEWWENTFSSKYKLRKYTGKYDSFVIQAWNHQQKKIDELETRETYCYKAQLAEQEEEIQDLEAANARLFSDNADLESKLARAVEALRFYADDDANWFAADLEGSSEKKYAESMGTLARKTLEELEEKGE